MAEIGYALDTMDQFLGKELGLSDWVTIDQERINQFADCTGDHQWIHVDVDRAQHESPFGGTIAHGYLTLSLLPFLRKDMGMIPDGVAQALNYGTEKVRFLTPVRSGARVRVRVVLLSAEEKRPGQILTKTQNTIEIEGEEKPAMVAETLALLIVK